MKTHGRRLALLGIIVALACVGGCAAIQDGVAKIVGAPTSQEVRATADKIRVADQEIQALIEREAELRREQERAAAAEDRLAARRDVLERMQSELAAKLATAPSEARPVLLASMREVDRQIEGLSDESAAIGRLLAEFEDQIVRVQVAAGRAKRELAEHEQTLIDLDAATHEAIARAVGGVQAVGDQVGMFVPGAGAVTNQVTGTIGTLLTGLLGAGAAGGAVTMRARRRQHELEEDLEQTRKSRDGARKVIATTERFGLKEIATDENVRKQAKAALMGDDNARREFALAKAEA